LASGRADSGYHSPRVDLALTMLSEPLTYSPEQLGTAESSVSAVSWPAIFGGAIAAASTSLILVLLGSGFGLAYLSPWPNAGASATAFTIAAGLWLIIVQWLSSGLGGFITGRMRTKWVEVHTHEVFFRDTANGLLTWGLASLIGVAILTSVGFSTVAAGTRATASMASGAVSSLAQTRSYDMDSLFRGEKPELASSDADIRGQTTRIFVDGLRKGGVPDGDRTYLAGLVASRTGLSDADAQKRVDDVIAQEKKAENEARAAADSARKSTAEIAIFTALSMLIGAFIACAAAAYGGSLRDEHP
jgi:hypothetical protein